jgi:UDP-3-O-[3-hydroxymyristoyl] glucosamine N-acyltransferase
MEFTAGQIAAYLGGKVEGNADAKVHTFSNIDTAEAGALSFLYAPEYEHYLYTTKASIVLVSEDLQPREAVAATMVRVKEPREAVARLLNLYEQSKPKRCGVSERAFVSETAHVGKDVYIGPLAYIGDNVTIGDGTQIYPNVTIEEGSTVGAGCIIYPGVSVYHDCHIGSSVILHSGCVIGADGFGFAPTPAGYEKIPQIGNVVIEDNVEIGANTCVDRSMMGTTRVGRGVKLDNLVQIAHNDVIGPNTVMSAQVGVAGSTEVGEWCMFGGQVGIAGHVRIASRTHSGAQAGIAGPVIKEGRTLLGSPAIDARRFAKSAAVFRNLPDMFRRLNELEEQVKTLTKDKQEK